MKKTVFIISALAVLVSCSRKSQDFIGVYNFKVMDTYIVKDSTETINTFFRNEPLPIKVNKMVSMKIDLFESGEEIKGTLTMDKYQAEFGLETINKYSQKKIDFKNIHLINDTLIAEVASKKKTTEFKLAKSGNEAFLIIQADEKEGKKEECNRLATVTNNNIIYKSLNGDSNELELIKQSNECEVNKTVTRCLETGYKSSKSEYLKQILSVELKK